MKAVALLSVITALCLLALYAWRIADHRRDKAEAARLLAFHRDQPPLFSQSMVDGLPEPAQRYFRFAIKDGTPLYQVAQISMRGRFGTGDKDSPNYMPMTADQVLAAPEGFLWKMSGGSGAIRISGSDSTTWTRFWLAGLVPVARTGGTSDHQLSGFGRLVSEAVFWTPAAVLPGPAVRWEPVDENTARVTMTHKGLCQAVDVTVDADGRAVQVMLKRWSNANADGLFRFQPFGGHLSEYREFSGFQLPTHVEAGNMFGTDAYFPFYIADVSDVHYGR